MNMDNFKSVLNNESISVFIETFRKITTLNFLDKRFSDVLKKASFSEVFASSERVVWKLSSDYWHYPTTVLLVADAITGESEFYLFRHPDNIVIPRCKEKTDLDLHPIQAQLSNYWRIFNLLSLYLKPSTL